MVISLTKIIIPHYDLKYIEITTKYQTSITTKYQTSKYLSNIKESLQKENKMDLVLISTKIIKNSQDVLITDLFKDMEHFIFKMEMF